MKIRSGKKPRRNSGKSKKLLAKKSLTVRRGGIPLLLVDCQPICYAAFHANGPLSYNGKPTGVIYGFIRRIFDLCEKFKTNRVIFFWDSKATYRYNDYKLYKYKRVERRAQMEAEDIVEHNQMFQQIVELSKVILPDMGFNNNFVFHGFEADDIIAHLLMEKNQEGRKIIISNDGDFYQLLDMADMYLFMMEKIFTKRLFVKKYGIKVSQWARAKAIGGCESDDVPGIEGVSDPKHVSSKALKFINKQLTKTGKIYARIVSKEGKKIIRRNKILVKLPYRPERIPPYEVAKDKVTLKKIIKVFTKYGFVSLCEREYFEKIEANFKG